jgi:MYXO-CTERM domain-containing protein
VAPDVLLTAAHCTEQTGTGDFYFHGHDVSDMPVAERYPVDHFVVHPEYDLDPDDPRDIALVFLEEPLDGVDPIPVNVTPFTDDWIGTWLHFVGYGDATGFNQGDVGLKHETDIELDVYWERDFYHYTPGTNVCGGDSGGPGLVDLDGVWHIAGVNKAVHVHADQVGNDPCDGFGWDMRVDAEQDFLGQYIDLPEVPGGDDTGDDDAGDDDAGDDDGADDGTGCSCRVDGSGGLTPVALILILAAGALRRNR